VISKKEVFTYNELAKEAYGKDEEELLSNMLQGKL